MLHAARRGTLVGMVRTGATFADAAAEYLRYIEQDRGRKRSTLSGYRSALNAHLLPAFGELALEDVTPERIEHWLAGLTVSPRSRNKLLVELHGILKRARKVWGLQSNAAAEVEKAPVRSSGDLQVFAPEEVWALVRAAANQLDAALFLTAAFTGLRMGELLALRWRDVDFAGSTVRVGRVTTTALSPRPSPGRCGRSRSRRTWRRPCRGSATASTGRGMTTWSSSGRRAATSTAPRCAGATSRRSGQPACETSASTICATPSGRG